MMEKINRLTGSRPDITITGEQLEHISVPTILLWGSNDPFGSVETGENIAGMLKIFEFHKIHHSGYLPWLDYPVECGLLISNVIKNGCE